MTMRRSTLPCRMRTGTSRYGSARDHARQTRHPARSIGRPLLDEAHRGVLAVREKERDVDQLLHGVAEGTAKPSGSPSRAPCRATVKPARNGWRTTLRSIIMPAARRCGRARCGRQQPRRKRAARAAASRRPAAGSRPPTARAAPTAATRLSVGPRRDRRRGSWRRSGTGSGRNRRTAR